MTYNVYMDGELVNTEGPVELEKANGIAKDCNLAKRDNHDIHEVLIKEAIDRRQQLSFGARKTLEG